MFRVWLAILESVHDSLLSMNMMEIVGYLHTLHKPDDRLSEDEPCLMLPPDLIERAVNFRVHDREIRKLQEEFQKLEGHKFK